MKCQHCQQQHPIYYTYCPDTGMTVDDTLNKRYQYKTIEFCISCGRQNNEGYSCCPNCGSNLLKTEEQKSGFSKLLNPTNQNSPISGETIAKHINKEQLKSVSKENLNYIKQNRFILAPIISSIVLMLLFGFMMKNMAFSFMKDMVYQGMDEEVLMYLDDDLLERELSKQFEENIDVPSFPYVTTFIMFAHNASYEYRLSLPNYYDGQDSYKGKLINGSYGFIIITLFILSIGAVIYGVMANKKNWPFWRGVVYSTILYTIFIGIIAFIARYNLKLSFDAFDMGVKIEGSLVPSILGTMLSSALLAATVFSVVGYIAYYGKKSLAQLHTETKYFQYALYALGVTAVGLVIHLLNMFIMLGKLKNESQSDLYNILDINVLTQSALGSVVALYYSVVNWNLSLFGKLNIFSSEGNASEVHYQWFMNSNADSFATSMLKDQTLLVPPFVFVLLAALCIGYAGYLLYNRHQLDFKEVAIFAGIFTFIQLVIIYSTGITLEMNNNYDFKFQWSYSFLNTLLGSFILSYIAFYAGGYVKAYLRK